MALSGGKSWAWMKRHKVVTTVAGVIVALFVIAGAAGGSNTKKTAATPSETSISQRPSSSSTAAVTTVRTTAATSSTLAQSVATTLSGCRPGNPLTDVYHPDRLTVINPCATVSGTVMVVRVEDDGDTHFDLALDPAYTSLLQPGNYSGQHGWLVVEIVPADKPGCTPGQPPRPASGSYDYGICTGAGEPAPLVGAHVKVTGPYVLDLDHGGWAEIHPVWAITGATTPSTPTTAIASPPPGATQAPPASTTAPAWGLSIVSVTSPVRAGAEASLVARTSPGANCNLSVTLPSGRQSESSGLGPGTANASGQVTWNWETGSRTNPGTATATVTCASAMATATFQITS